MKRSEMVALVIMTAFASMGMGAVIFGVDRETALVTGIGTALACAILLVWTAPPDPTPSEEGD